MHQFKEDDSHNTNYIASPTASKFLKCTDYMQMLMGPVGCGKTASCCIKILMTAMAQAKAPDGIRYTRWVVVRNTYEQLRTTTVKTWQDWTRWANTRVTYTSPISHHLRFNDVDLEVWFISLEGPKDIRKLLSLDTTGVWLNEARELHWASLEAATQRCSRYPQKELGHPTWFGVIGDTNPPDDDHWFYKTFEEKKPENYTLFKYPPGLLEQNDEYVLNPNAENLNNLVSRYYLNMAAGKSKEWIKVYLQGQYGTVSDGMKVYPEFNADLHVKANLKVLPDVPLVLGWDFGLTPACVICQITPHGQLYVLDELQAVHTGIKTFARDVVLPFLHEKYSEHPYSSLECYADPAGKARLDSDESSSCIGILNELGLMTEPANTNLFAPRRNAVAEFLNKLIEGSPGFLISDRCQILIKGFKGHYRHRRVEVIGEERYKNEPEKNNIYSHLQDALQYVALMSSPRVSREPILEDMPFRQPPPFFAR